ncbi:MAG TPA: DUF3793 domain-containing protein [Treponema sp.]|nr:DUF3793 domain-containing protein [Treponema sp.]
MGFDQTLLYFGAPALCGLKAANLVSVADELADANGQNILAINEELAQSGRKIVRIKRGGGRTLFFLYDRNMLGLAVSKKNVQRYLAKKNYPVYNGLDAILAELLRRLSSQTDFPHEIGIFLGYPLADVILFEKSKGKGCLYSGLWKVYGNVQESVCKMTLYRNCCVRCSRLFERGMKLTDISRNYNKIAGLPEPV